MEPVLSFKSMCSISFQIWNKMSKFMHWAVQGETQQLPNRMLQGDGVVDMVQQNVTTLKMFATLVYTWSQHSVHINYSRD